ncbi:tRNA pseudouridine(38/39) synthase [Drosophila grimshawi]|uniref:GH21331 n=1 Tax=Drosophila grimshawi TaxID=7222 RepID=B4J8B2_DROGR|nr:tRNA pseudouridine(38/39) synthase [Drosophila grimshawi]EDW01249.1 GH21331 [Drosophila grimshawi]
MSKKVVINKRAKGLSRDALEQLSKTELIDKIEQLEAYNFQLKNILQKKLTENDRNNAEYTTLLRGDTEKPVTLPTEENTSKKEGKQRKFNWDSANRRHVLLKVMYFGWDYQGFACQEDSNETIEAFLFRALIRTCLIESRATSNYHRCGRTDKEVSAFCQVISIDLRSKHAPDVQLESDSLATEIDYCSLLNRVLPKNIQCVSWMPLRNHVYSARFDCISRTYRYYFPKGDLDIEAMRMACDLIVCHGDFRNFCKMDVHNGVTNYMRNLQAARIQACEGTAVEVENDLNSGYTMYYLEIQANAFLWHQIRCIMAVLLLVGQKHEEPVIISKLLDVVSNPCKPQYTPAIGLPLNLFRCDFRANTTRRTNPSASYSAPDEDNAADDASSFKMETAAPCEPDLTDWVYSEENLQKLVENVQNEWTQFSVKCTMIRNTLEHLEMLVQQKCKPQKINAQALLLQDAAKPRQYQPLLQRKRCESLENRIDHFVKKQRLLVKGDMATEAK